MKQFLKNIAKFLKKKAPALTLVIAAAIVCSFVMDIDLVSAVDASTGDTKAKTEESLGFLISLLIQGLNLFLWPFLVILGDLMDNDMIIGPGMEDTLLSIWIQIRNLVNIGFAVFLLIIAFYNVLPLGENEGNLAMKTALPKLVIGLILVNFTFLGGKVILDIANVGTTASFALPELVETFDFDKEREEFTYAVCWKEVTQSAEESGGAGTYITQWDTNTDGDNIPVYTMLFCEVDEDTGVYTGQLNEAMSSTYFQDLNSNNIGLIMAINMGALDSLSLLKDGAINDFSDLVINSMFSLVMYFIMACTYVVLGLVLLARIVVLWVALALSPVIVLFYVIPQLKEAVGSNLDIMEKVTKHLLAPIIIGLTLSIGYIMISALGEVGNISSMKASEMMSTEFMASGIDDMEKFIIAIASVVIVWTGVFAAASGTYAEFATNAVKGFGEKIGGAVAKAPLYATTVPVGVGTDGKQVKVAPMAIFGLADAAINNLQGQQRLNQQLQQMSESSPSIKKLIGNMGGADLRSKADNAAKATELAQRGELTHADMADLANSLYNTTKATGLASKTLIADLEKAKAAAATGNLAPLQKILNDTANTAEILGLDATQYSAITQGMRKAPTVKKDAPDATAEPAKTAPATSGGTVNPLQTRLSAAETGGASAELVAGANTAIAAAQNAPNNTGLQAAAEAAVVAAEAAKAK